MDKGRRLARAILGALAWMVVGLDVAQAGTIPPTNPTTLKLDTGAPVSVSLYQLDGTLPGSVTLSSPSRCTTTGTAYYKDVTDCWLPEVGKSVFVVINGASPGAVPALASPAALPALPLDPTTLNPFVSALTSSAYPGQCINVGSATDIDFLPLGVSADAPNALPAPTTLPTSANTSVVGWELIPQDCGAMAVIEVDGYKIVVPRDGTELVAANGIPEIWENVYGGNLDPAGDGDTGPGANTPVGDGISTLDEYRGAMVSGRQERLHPLLKDAFVRAVGGQCPTTTSSTTLIGPGGFPKPTFPSATLTIPGGAVGAIRTFTANAGVFAQANVRGEIVATGGGRARIVAFTSATSVAAEITEEFPGSSAAPGAWQVSEALFGSLYGLLSSERIRVLDAGEWVDTFVSYNDFTGVRYTADGSTLDRVVNPNRLYGGPQKGIRGIECLDDGSTAPYGFALGGAGSPNALGGQIGNVVIYTKRVVNQINSLFTAGGTRRIRYSPMLEPVTKGSSITDWNPKILAPDASPTATTGDGDPANAAVKDFIIGKAFLYYWAHEAGHHVFLNVTAAESPHFASFSGDQLDTGLVNRRDRTDSPSTFNTFYIPSTYGVSDQNQLILE